mgnify:CR=1 FL=1
MFMKSYRVILCVTVLLSMLTYSFISHSIFENKAFADFTTFSFSGSSSTTQFTTANGVYQDGNLAVSRDSSGNLYAILGHTNSGSPLQIWKGTSIIDMTLQYNATLNFSLGAAGTAFNNTYYPDGGGNVIKSRGQIWPLGLYIDSVGKFYAYIHNETGWSAGGTGYSSTTGGDPGEPDFRHIALMTSTDQGHNWNFDSWIITGSQIAYTTIYRPDGLTTGGQVGPSYNLGSGDQSFFDNPNDGYLYMFYSEITSPENTDNIYVARALKSNPSVWNKYFNGSWSEPGNTGLGTSLLTGGAVPSVAWSTYLNKYIMTSYNRTAWNSGTSGLCTLQISTSSDLVNWSAPQLLSSADTTFNKPYWTILNSNTSGNIKVVGQTFEMYYNQFADNIRKVSVTSTITPSSNLASGAVVTATSSYEDPSWGIAKVNDGQRSSVSGSNGWSSDNSLTVNHTESITLDMGTSNTIGKVDLYPRNDSGNVGYGFPIDFTIKTSTDGTTYTPVVTQTGYALPGNGVQSFSFASTSARYVKVEGTGLRSNPSEVNRYRMQFAEIEIYSASASPTPTPTPTPTSYQASVGYSSTQGTNNWSYQYWGGSAYTNMTWDSANTRWNKSGTYSIVGNTWQHPDVSADSVRKFTAPTAGTITITGAVMKGDVGGGDGVNVKILKNGTQIWPASGWQFIAYNDTTGYNVNVSTSVAVNDAIYFIVNHNSTISYDKTDWDPLISY